MVSRIFNKKLKLTFVFGNGVNEFYELVVNEKISKGVNNIQK